MAQQKAAVLSGYWPLMRYNPELRLEGKNPFQLDSRAPSIPFKQYAYQEARYTMLARSNPETARELLLPRPGGCSPAMGCLRKPRGHARRCRSSWAASHSEPALIHSATRYRWRDEMIDITTTYLGLPMKSPIVASASPLCESLENIRHLEDAGVGAVVLPSLFEEQLDLESHAVDSDLSRGSESFAESINYLPDLHNYNLGADGYLELIRKARERVSIPVIASLNGVSPGGWARYAGMMEQAGADAIELNIYAIITDPNISRRRCRAELLRSGATGEGECQYSCRGEVFSLLQRDREHGQTTGRGRRERPGPL